MATAKKSIGEEMSPIEELKENELPKSEISELALIDAEGDIVSIITFEKKVKDEGAQMIFEKDDEF